MVQAIAVLLAVSGASAAAACSSDDGGERGTATAVSPDEAPPTTEPLEPAMASLLDRAPARPVEITTAADADAWAMRLAVEHDAPYPGRSASAWLPSSTAQALLGAHRFRLQQGEGGPIRADEVLAVGFTATDRRAVFSFEGDDGRVSYGEDSLLYLFDPGSGAAWVTGMWHEEVETAIAAGRPLD